MPRRYDPDIYQTYRRHKAPEGWGSLCPEKMTIARAQELLDSGVDVGGHVYNVDGELAYRAQHHTAELWHGHPIPWSRLPNAARHALIAAGRLTDAQWRKAIRQNLGNEFLR